ncbi:MAG TPA: TspO/MBR family protein [Ramlibacter sp.]
MQAVHPSAPHHARASQWVGLVAWLAVTFAAAVVGSLASINASEFYLQLDRPEWAPPAALFGPVWTVLYLMMGMAAWFVWREYGWRHAHVALTVYVVQLVLNALWSWLFFEWHQGEAAMLDIAVLWGLIALNLLMFFRAHRVAGLLLVPYLAWVTFAAALTYTLWQMNPDLLG